jgi:hypothetical protein
VRFVGNTLGIDTISHGVLTAVCLPGGEIYQSESIETSASR